MKLLELYIREFGALKDKRLVLGEGLNLFEGENETGKSTVMLFIQFMLYGLPRRGHPFREKAISRSGHTAAGSMRLSFEGEEYQIERSFIGSGRGSEKLAIYRQRDGEKVFAGEEPGQVFLKVPREIFESSCSIGQMQCAGLGGEKGAAAIRNLLSSADESVDLGRVVKKLEDIRVRYRHKTGKGGRLYDLNEEINACKLRLDRATENHLRIAELGEKIKEVALHIEKTETQLKEAEILVNEMHRVELLRRFDEMHKNEKELLSVQTERRALQEEKLRTAYIPTEADLAALNMVGESLARSEEECAEAQRNAQSVANAADYDGDAAAVGEKLRQTGENAVLARRLRNLRLGRTVLTVGAVASLVCACVIGWLLVGTLRLALSGSVFAVAVGLGIGSMLCASKAKAIAKRYGKTPKELPAYLNACEQAYEARLRAEELLASAKAKQEAVERHRSYLQAKLSATLRKTGCDGEPTVENARNEAKRLGEFLSADLALERRIDTLIHLVEKDGRILSIHDEEALRQSIPLAVGELTEEKMTRATRTKGLCEDKLRMLRLSDKQLKEEKISREASTENPLSVADRLEALRAEYSACEEYYEAVLLAIDGLQTASETMSGNITPAISRNAGKMMEYISDGRYTELETGSGLAVSLSEDGTLLTSDEMLSGGTRDAAYISLRIALMMQIFGRELPPLMMDEALCQMDDRRMGRLLGLLGKLCEGDLQCLLFTCHRREAETCLALGVPVRRISLNRDEEA